MQISSKPEGAELFSDPLEGTYLLRTIFTMPSVQGGYRGVALTDRESFYLAAGYALLITAIFGCLWQFVTYFALVFYPTEDRRAVGDVLRRNNSSIETKKNADYHEYHEEHKTTKKLLDVRQRKANRYIALVAVWNSSDPYTAMMLLVTHFRAIFWVDKRAARFDALLIFAALVLVAGGIFAGIVVPANLEMGNVAPANPTSIFFPAADINNSTQDLIAQKVRAGAAQRAAGVVEYARDQLRQRVKLSDDRISSYEFTVTGVDFGLQLKDAVDFKLYSVGGCIFNESVYNETYNDGTTFDIYPIFGTIYSFAVDPLASRSVGGTIVMPAATNVNEVYNSSGGNMTYAIIPDTVARSSYTQSTDPWYLTEPTPQEDVESGLPPYRISGRRPALVCWQKDEWSYKGKTVNLNELDKLGLDLPEVILQNLFRDRFTYPMTYDIGVALGSSILLMSASSSAGILDARSGSYADDFERLILAAYVSTQDVFRDSTMSQYSPSLGIRNAAFDAAGKPIEGVGKFVISSTKVKSVSLRVLVSIPAIWAFLHLALLATRCTRFAHRNSGKVSRFTLRATGLQAMQLYRMLDEEKCGNRDDWNGRLEHIPYILEAKEASERRNDGGRMVARPQPSTTPSQDGKISEISTDVGGGGNTEHTPQRTHGPFPQLYLAPKVIRGHDGRNHLAMVGPMKYQSSKDDSYNKFDFHNGEGSEAIADGPADLGNARETERSPEPDLKQAQTSESYLKETHGG